MFSAKIVRNLLTAVSPQFLSTAQVRKTDKCLLLVPPSLEERRRTLVKGVWGGRKFVFFVFAGVYYREKSTSFCFCNGFFEFVRRK
jgi:hypothetical protein